MSLRGTSYKSLTCSQFISSEAMKKLRVEKKTSSCLEDSYLMGEKIERTIDFIIILYLWELQIVVGVGELFVSHSFRVLSRDPCFFPSTMWVLGIKLRPSGLAVITFAHGVTSLNPCYGFAFYLVVVKLKFLIIELLFGLSSLN